MGELFPRCLVDVAELEEIQALSAAELTALTAPAPTVTLTVRPSQSPRLDEFDHHVRGLECSLRVEEDGTQVLDLTDLLTAALYFDPEEEEERAALARLAAEEDEQHSARGGLLDEEEDEDHEEYDRRTREHYERLRRIMGR